MLDWRIDCLACRIVTGEETVPGGIIHQEEYWEVRLGHGLLRRGWTVVTARAHHPSVGELSQGAQDSMGRVLARTAAAVKEAFSAQAVYVCSFGETVAHVHFHVIPRLPNDRYGGPTLVERMFRRMKPRVTPAQAEDDGRRLRTAFVEVVSPLSRLPPPPPAPRDKLRTAPDVRETGPSHNRPPQERYAAYDGREEDG